MSSKVGVFVGQLESQGGEYEMQVAPVFEIPRAKEGGSQKTFCEHTFSDGLSDGRFPRPSKPVKPEDGRLVEVSGPRFDLVQDSLSRAPEATSAIPMFVCGPTGTAAAVQHRQFDCTKRGLVHARGGTGRA